MKYETLRRMYRPETEREREALIEAADRAGTYPECRDCRRCLAGCELIYIDYEAAMSSDD